MEGDAIQVEGSNGEKGMGMTDQAEQRMREREEFAARIAAFRATQEKFKREREAYFVSTMEDLRDPARKVERPSFWP